MAYASESGVDSVTQYELWKAIWSSLHDRNFFELAWTLDRHNQVLAGVTPQTFVGNHDVTRLASQLTDERHLGHALAVLFTVGGIPSVYYGDEQAFRGVKADRAGGDDEIRPASPPARPSCPRGLAHLPAAPAPHRLPSPPPLARPRADHRGAPDQRGLRFPGRCRWRRDRGAAERR